MGPILWWAFILFLKALPALLAGGSAVALAQRDEGYADQVYAISSSGSGGSFLIGMVAGGLILHFVLNGKSALVESWKKKILEWISAKLAAMASKIKPEGV